jgi:hypothetical protein
MGPTLNQNAQAFGSFGVVLAFTAIVLIAITISIACAVFGPVWEEFRQAEEDRKASKAKTPAAEATPGARVIGALLRGSTQAREGTHRRSPG